MTTDSIPMYNPKYERSTEAQVMADTCGQTIQEIQSEMVFKLFKNPREIQNNLQWDTMPEDIALAHALTGCGSEGAELADIAKKIIFHNKPVTPQLLEHVMEELGDLHFYVEALEQTLSSYYGIHNVREKALALNVDKLWLSKNARYSEGKYSDAQAHARADKVVEGETTSSLNEGLEIDGRQDNGSEEHF